MRATITPTKLHGTIEAMPSKSHAHRLLIARKLAALQAGQNAPAGGADAADGSGPAAGGGIPSFSADIEATKACLQALDDACPVMDCGESGSTIRFLLPVTMALRDCAHFYGSGKLPERPLSPLREVMEEHGAAFETAAGPGPEGTDGSNGPTGLENLAGSEGLARPEGLEDSAGTRKICSVTGRLRPGTYRLAGNVSSQFITGLLFALPLLGGHSSIHLTTPLESSGYVDMTLDVLRTFGIRVDVTFACGGLLTYHIPGNQTYTAPERVTVEGDWSNASFWLACGALGGDVTCTGLSLDSSQKDRRIADVLRDMGAEVTAEEGSVTVKSSGKLRPAVFSAAQTPDMVPVLAAVMAGAEGTSRITDAGRLRIKESDRLRSVSEYLSLLGCEVTEEEDGLVIKGCGSLAGGTVSSWNDHRIAMAAAAASCICREAVTVLDAGAVRKSYPDFWKDFAALGGRVTEE